MIQIYGSPRSSAGRCYLALEEMGIPYQQAQLDMSKKEQKSEAFLKLNPNGKVPCLVDGDFVVWESLAINSYLADKYKPELLGTTPQERALVNQWSVWGLVELQPPLVEILVQMIFVPEERRDHGVIAKARDKAPHALAILDKALAGKTYLVGEKLTLADLNLASVVNMCGPLQQPTDSYRNINSWFDRIKSRPSFQKFTEKRG